MSIQFDFREILIIVENFNYKEIYCNPKSKLLYIILNYLFGQNEQLFALFLCCYIFHKKTIVLVFIICCFVHIVVFIGKWNYSIIKAKLKTQMISKEIIT